MYSYYAIDRVIDRHNSHNFSISQLDLGLIRDASPSPQVVDGWVIGLHPFLGYTLENSPHDYILGCFATTAAAAKFAAYLPAAADCDFRSIRFGGAA